MHLLFNPHNTPVNWVLFPHVGTDASFLGPEIYAVWVALLKEKTKQRRISNTVQHRSAPSGTNGKAYSWKETPTSTTVAKLPYGHKLYKAHDHINTLPRFSCTRTENSDLEACPAEKNPPHVCPCHRRELGDLSQLGEFRNTFITLWNG